MTAVDGRRGLARLALAPLAPLHWLERARGRKRLALVALYLAVLAVPLAFAAREVTLRGLPDLGDPFDVAAFRADDPGGLYRRAAAAFVPPKPSYQGDALTRMQFGGPRGMMLRGWLRQRGEEADPPEFLAWVEANRDGLELWRRATEGPGPADHPLSLDPGRRVVLSAVVTNPNAQAYPGLAWREAKRREEAGDMAGAWALFRARLRYSRHLAMRAGFIDRFEAGELFKSAAAEIDRWADDDRVDAPLLRRALADVRAAAGLTIPDSDLLKADYLRVMHELDHRTPKLDEGVREDFVNAGDATSEYRHLPGYQAAVRFFGHEPERSRRVIRQFYANRLAHADDPPGTATPTVPALGIILYAPAAPLPGALPGTKLAPWLEQPGYARRLIVGDPIFYLQQFRAERGRLAQTVVHLAEQLYRRDHGRPPASPKDLVGRYLDALPEAFVDPADASSAGGTSP